MGYWIKQERDPDSLVSQCKMMSAGYRIRLEQHSPVEKNKKGNGFVRFCEEDEPIVRFRLPRVQF